MTPDQKQKIDTITMKRSEVEKVKSHMTAICKGSLYDVNWLSDGKDYGQAVQALSILEAALGEKK